MKTTACRAQVRNWGFELRGRRLGPGFPWASHEIVRSARWGDGKDGRASTVGYVELRICARRAACLALLPDAIWVPVPAGGFEPAFGGGEVHVYGAQKRQYAPFDAREDAILWSMRRVQKASWADTCKALGRNHSSVVYRYRALAKKRGVESEKNDKHFYSREEDEALLDAMVERGCKWEDISRTTFGASRSRSSLRVRCKRLTSTLRDSNDLSRPGSAAVDDFKDLFG